MLSIQNHVENLYKKKGFVKYTQRVKNGAPGWQIKVHPTFLAELVFIVEQRPHKDHVGEVFSAGHFTPQVMKSSTLLNIRI